MSKLFVSLCVGFSAALLLAAGCSAIPGFGDGGESQKTADLGVNDGAGASSSSSSGVDTASGSSSGGAEDSGPAGCSPSCDVWQLCASGVCSNKACTKDVECNASGGPPAGVKPHYCFKGKCALFQCGKDEDCDKGHTCHKQTFTCYQKKTGCSFDADCIDSNICTSDTCDTKTGKCAHLKVATCCNADLECDDGSDCTTDTCDKQLSKCENTAKDKFCTSDANCADSNSCTTDTCDKATGQCKFTKKGSCCEHAGQCDDGVEATADSCVKGACVHFGGGAKTCAKQPDCAQNACSVATCVQGMCSHASGAPKKPECCAAVADCGSETACIKSDCVALLCQKTKIKGIGPWLWQHFDTTGIDGWTAKNENKSASWHFYTGTKAAGAGSLRYGLAGKKTWSAGFPNKGSVTSKAIAVPKGGKLSFFIHFDGEPGAGVHQFGLKVVEAGKEVDLWTKNGDLKGSTAGAWKPATADLSKWAGKKIQLRWWFDVAVQFPKEDGHGLAIDEMILSGDCQ